MVPPNVGIVLLRLLFITAQDRRTCFMDAMGCNPTHPPRSRSLVTDSHIGGVPPRQFTVGLHPMDNGRTRA